MAGKTIEELSITRDLDAPRDAVFKAWTDRDLIMRWMAPKGFTIPFCEAEVRPGGMWRMRMRKPEGNELGLQGVYREIAPPERLVFTHAWLDDDGTPLPENLVSVKLFAQGNKTKLDFRQGPFPSADERDGHRDGWNECFDRLEEVLAGSQSAAR